MARAGAAILDPEVKVTHWAWSSQPLALNCMPLDCTMRESFNSLLFKPVCWKSLCYCNLTCFSIQMSRNQPKERHVQRHWGIRAAEHLDSQEQLTQANMWVSAGVGREDRSPFVKRLCTKLRMLEKGEEKMSRKNRKGENKMKKWRDDKEGKGGVRGSIKKKAIVILPCMWELASVLS